MRRVRRPGRKCRRSVRWNRLELNRTQRFCRYATRTVRTGGRCCLSHLFTMSGLELNSAKLHSAGASLSYTTMPPDVGSRFASSGVIQQLQLTAASSPCRLMPAFVELYL